MYIQLANEKKYRLNLDKIIEYFAKSTIEKATQSDITELYRQGFEEMELIQKQINTSTVKNGNLNMHDQYRYDIIKGMLETLFTTGLYNDGGGSMVKHLDTDANISIAESVVWNTLISYGFLEEI